jgi:CubicO group peptidase (beta-lactamase class C family)
VSLEDDITDHMHIDIKGNPGISFKQLANHTSGLPRLPSNIETVSFDPDNPYQAYGEKQLKQYLLEEMELEQTPGERFSYSNLGAGLLGFVLEKLDGKSYEQLVQEKIFSKYGMINSTTLRKSVEQILIKGLYENGNEVPNWDLSVLVGAGGALSSTEDLSKFVLAQFDPSNEVLKMTRSKTFTVNHISDIGLGWEIINRKSGDLWYKHSGGTGGYTSAMIMDVNNKNGIVILSNVSDYNSKRSIIEDWSFELMKSLYQSN